MKSQIRQILSGLGYYKLSEHRRRLLTTVLLISLFAHLLALVIFGSWVVMRHLREEETVFVAPPPMRTYEPRQLEHRVRVQQQQRSSSRPALTPRMVAMTPSDFSLPEIVTDPKIVKTTFQPTFRPVQGVGLGIGLGTGFGLGGFGTGVSQFNFFGIRGRGERIAIILDVSISMAEETEELGVTERGIEQFTRVKRRVGEVIDSMSETTMFNVIVYAESASAWQDKMQVASESNKQSAKDFIRPFNSSVSWDAVGHRSGIQNLSAGMGHMATGGTTRFDTALSLAIQSGADMILVICDGDVWTTKARSSEEIEAHRLRLREWERQAAAPRGGTVRTERVWIPARPASGAVIRERGGRRAQPAREGRWVERQVREGGRSVPSRPQLPTAVWSLEDYIKHIDKLHEEFLAPAGRPKPTIHVIGFRSAREDSAFLRRLARHYGGQFRRVTFR